MNVNICPPALIYIVFSLTQIIIDLIKGFYNTAIMKFVVMTIIGFLLNVLCQNGLGIISWIIVFIPFVLMTVIVAMLLYIFGLKETSGTITPNPNPNPEDTATDSIIIQNTPAYHHGFSSKPECLYYSNTPPTPSPFPPANSMPPLVCGSS